VPLPEQRSSSVVLRQGVAGAVAADEPLTFNNQVRRLHHMFKWLDSGL
jgi:hypothetical protein